MVSPIAFINEDALDLAPGEGLGLIEHARQRVSIRRIARERFGMQYKLATRSTRIGGHDGDFDAELIGACALPLPMHSTSGAWKGQSFQPRWRRRCERIWMARESNTANAASRSGLPLILARYRASGPSRVRKKRNSRWCRLNCWHGRSARPSWPRAWPAAGKTGRLDPVLLCHPVEADNRCMQQLCVGGDVTFFGCTVVSTLTRAMSLLRSAPVHVLEQQRSDDEAGLDPGSAVVA
jgi:hypothetical protein